MQNSSTMFKMMLSSFVGGSFVSLVMVMIMQGNSTSYASFGGNGGLSGSTYQAVSHTRKGNETRDALIPQNTTSFLFKKNSVKPAAIDEVTIVEEVDTPSVVWDAGINTPTTNSTTIEVAPEANPYLVTEDTDGDVVTTTTAATTTARRLPATGAY